MDVTEVTIKLQPPRVRHDGGVDDKLLAFASVVLDGGFVVHGLKVVARKDGRLFVDPPSRQLEANCRGCSTGNALRDHFCRRCGIRLDRDRILADAVGPEGKVKLYASVAHPIHEACRETIEGAVLEAYRDEVEAAKAGKPTAPLAGRLAAIGRA